MEFCSIGGEWALAGRPCLWFSLENAARVIPKEWAVIQERAEAITLVVTTTTQAVAQCLCGGWAGGPIGQSSTVVAREVRRFADQTAEAAAEIRSLV